MTDKLINTDWGSEGKEWRQCECQRIFFLTHEQIRRASWRNVQPVVSKMIFINTRSGVISVFHRHSDGRVTYASTYDADRVSVDKNYVTMFFGKDFPL